MKRILLMSFLLLGMITSAWAQRTVTGRVTSQAEGEGLPGVAVRVKGGTGGTVTDMDGNFRIEVPADNSVLSFSFVGYTSREVVVGTRSVVNVQLAEDVQQLQEVVVTGYGTTLKSEVQGAITSVRGDVIENLPMQSFDRALQGRAAGVQVNASSGQPGGGININVRGLGSLANNQPLYIVDGVQVNTGGLTGQGSSNALASINPNDIESFEILKDAAAAAIYGAQAANGVVIITTKRGERGRTKFNLSAQEGIVQPLNLYEVMDARQFAQFNYDAYVNSGRNPQTAIDLFGDPANENLQTYSRVDELFRTARTRMYELSASGGDEKTRFFISGSYNKQEGQIIRSDWSRATFRANFDHKASDKLSFRTNITGARQETNGSISDGYFINSPFMGAFASWPNQPIYNEDGSFAPYTSNHFFGYNIVQGVHEETRNGQTYSMVGNIGATYQIIPSLSFTSFAGINVDAVRDLNNRPSTIPLNASFGGQTAQTDVRALGMNTNHNFNYYQKFSDIHTVSGILGVEYKDASRELITATGRGFAKPSLYTLANTATPFAVGGTYTEYKRAGVFGQMKYDYDERYAAEFTLRRDGHSRFGAENRWGTFYAGAASWRISREAFLENVSAISDLKMRVSYGVTGNSNGIGDFSARTLYGRGGQYIGGAALAPTQLGDENLSWERAKQINLGLDFGLFSNRLFGSFDIWRTDTDNQLLFVNLPTDSGFGGFNTNAGEVRNEGIDLMLNSVLFDRGGFRWRTDFNISFLRNELLSLADGQQEAVITDERDRAIRLQVGQPIRQEYGFEFAGINPANGRPMLIDSAGNLAYRAVERDRKVIGKGISDFYGGLNNSFSFKGLTLEVFFQYDYGRDILNGHLQDIGTGGYSGSNLLASEMNYWTQPGQITNVAAPYVNGIQRSISQPFFGGNWYSDRFVSDGSYIRLKQVTLGYDLPATLIRNIGLSKLNVFVQGINLATWTNFDGIDPEVSDQTSSSFGTYPNGRVFTAGLSVGF